MHPVSQGKAAVSTWSHRHNPSPPNTSLWASCSHQGQQARTAIPPAAAATCGQHQPFQAGTQVLLGLFLELRLVPTSLVPTTHLKSRTLAGGVAPLQGLPSRSSLRVSLHPALEPPVTCQSAPQESRESPHNPRVLEPQAGWDQACPGGRSSAQVPGVGGWGRHRDHDHSQRNKMGCSGLLGGADMDWLEPRNMGQGQKEGPASQGPG